MQTEFAIYTSEGDVETYTVKYWEFADANFEHNTVAYWEFPSSGVAYDAVQVNEAILTGCILVIPSEGVVGLADTWPIAITKVSGNLHSMNGRDWATKVEQNSEATGIAPLMFELAADIAERMGFETVRNR